MCFCGLPLSANVMSDTLRILVSFGDRLLIVQDTEHWSVHFSKKFASHEYFKNDVVIEFIPMITE